LDWISRALLIDGGLIFSGHIATLPSGFLARSPSFCTEHILIRIRRRWSFSWESSGRHYPWRKTHLAIVFGEAFVKVMEQTQIQY
jgi:hypothetical protein